MINQLKLSFIYIDVNWLISKFAAIFVGIYVEERNVGLVNEARVDYRPIDDMDESKFFGKL